MEKNICEVRTVNEGIESVRAVKNLGWLLRNWRDVIDITFELAYSPTAYWDGVLTARLYPKGREGASLQETARNYRLYVASFASKDLFNTWVRRPVFYGLPLIWRTADGQEHRETIQPLA